MTEQALTFYKEQFVIEGIPSKKLEKRLRTAYNMSKLIAVGGIYDGRMLKAPQFSLHFPSVPSGKGVLEQARFNAALPAVTQDLLFTGDHRLSVQGYIEGIGGHDFTTLPVLAQALADRNSQQSVIRTVHGATTEMPLRALSALLPSLTVMEKLKKDGVKPPQLQVISAHNVSGSLNLLDVQKARDQAHRFAYVARSYTKEFFPTLTKDVVFLEDTEFKEGSMLHNEISKNAKLLQDTSLQEQLRLKGENNGSAQHASLYGAAHTIMHDLALPGIFTPIFTDQQVEIEPEIIVSVGGKQERFFYELRHRMKPRLDERYHHVATMQYFTRHHVPPYYMARDGDISLQDALQIGTDHRIIGKTAQHDLSYLYTMSNSRGDFDTFIAKEGKRKL